jgi:hypothetical protein
MDIYDLLPFASRCTLICLDTLTRRRSNACVMLVFDVSFGRVISSNLLSLLNVLAISCELIFTTLTAAFTNPCMMQFADLMRSLVCSIFIFQGIHFLIV